MQILNVCIREAETLISFKILAFLIRVLCTCILGSKNKVPYFLCLNISVDCNLPIADLDMPLQIMINEF
jgi:hypothetical protein